MSIRASCSLPSWISIAIPRRHRGATFRVFLPLSCSKTARRWRGWLEQLPQDSSLLLIVPWPPEHHVRGAGGPAHTRREQGEQAHGRDSLELVNEASTAPRAFLEEERHHGWT